MPQLPTPAKQFADRNFTLSQLELDAINAAVVNLSDPDEKVWGHPADWVNSPFGKLEALSDDKCSLDRNAFQIMRCGDSTLSNPQWVRFGFQRAYDDKFAFEIFVRENMFTWTGRSQVDLPVELPDVARRLAQLRLQGARVVALLGSARMDIQHGMELIEPIQQLVDGLSDVAYMNGGYRGMMEGAYGVTRAGLDVPQANGKETLTVMCRAGIFDANVTARAISIYGQQWGDDTPGMAAASDGAVFLRNIPNGKVYGKWTFVEIANMLRGKKPIVILDPSTASADELLFGVKVPVVKTAAEAAAYLMKNLPSPAEIQARPPLAVQPTHMLPQIKYDDAIAIRLYFDSQNEFARWELQDAEGRNLFLDAGLQLSDRPEAFDGGRNLIIDGYWKDIMLLQYLNKLPKTLTDKSVLVRYYAECRSVLEALRTWDLKIDDIITRGTIADIWFLYRSEHIPGTLDVLKGFPPSPYAKRVTAAAAAGG